MMGQVATKAARGTDHFAARQEAFAVASAKDPSWLVNLRGRGIERFRELGFPGRKDEDWRFTNVAPIANTPFGPAGEPEVDDTVRKAVEAAAIPGEACRLVFVNGTPVESLGTRGALPKGLAVATLQEVLNDLEGTVGGIAPLDDHPFLALNTAFLSTGAFIDVPAGTVIEAPIHLIFVAKAGPEPVMCHPRVVIRAGKGSQVVVVEQWIGTGEGETFANTVSEIDAAEGATVDHLKLVRDRTEGAYHVGVIQGRQARDSRIRSHSVVVGGALVRNDIGTVLGGEGCESILNGFFHLTGAQHADHHTMIDHAKPHCTSDEFYKGIVDGKSMGVFNGRIVVRQDAQKTIAYQTNRNLVLSETALVQTDPQLEIYADDVKCSHGATIGQLDADALFYLRARGVPEAAAKSLLIYAFADEVFARLPVETIRTRLRRELADRLPGDGVIQEMLEG